MKNSYSISARFINSNEISCISPPSSIRTSDHNVSVSFSPNGIEFYEYKNLTFFYKSTCPPYEDDLPTCNGRGICRGTKCFCNENFNGIACENCIKTCNFNGICSNDNGNCICFPGFFGDFCEFQFSFWFFIFIFFGILILFLLIFIFILYFIKKKNSQFKLNSNSNFL